MQVKKKFGNDKWTISVLSFRAMKKVADGDADTCGLCVSKDRAIYIREDSVDYSIIAHECTHAYFSYLCLADTQSINFHDSEEIFCDFMAQYGEVIIKKSKEVTKALKQMMREQAE